MVINSLTQMDEGILKSINPEKRVKNRLAITRSFTGYHGKQVLRGILA